MPFTFNPIEGTFDLINATSVQTKSFTTIQTPAGTSPVASTATDTLTLTTSDNSLVITGDSSSDTIDFKLAPGYALLNSPTFTGTPTAPTPSLADSSTKLATTAFVQSQGYLTSTGAIPTGSADNATGATSATTTFVTVLTTTVTLTQTAPILAVVNATLTTTGSASVAGTRITINAVASRVALITLSAVTTNYLAASHFISASLAPGTYTVNFDIQRSSGTGTVNYASGTLVAEGLQGTNSNGISQLTGNVTAGPGSGSQVATIASNVITNAMVNSAAAIAYSKLAALTTGQALIGNAGVPTATTLGGDVTVGATGTVTIANNAITNVKVSAVDASKITTGTLAVARGGTGTTAFAAQRIPFGNAGATALQTDANFIYDTTNTRFSVGGNGSAKINAIVASGSATALQAFNQSAGNAIQATNVSAYTAALISRQNNATTGASIGLEFGRGTPAAPTGALNGDQIGVIAATPDAASGTSFGFSGSISFVASEDATTTATGGEIVFATTPNTTTAITERVRIKNSGETVFAAAIATAQYTTLQKIALTPAGGWVVFDTTLNQLSYYNGTIWVNV